ncbi:hypothetical protein Ddye_009297 [Dipteronia dyeriana]|uniref:Uncharacterized protein n=1 Tax=Dipteronia dyeriana TaxID=168575 RepID=A0AAE0CM47_9ROSI|nr:hypothetical protein Ddye_009297 [Dipteronia dyeriana]
MTYEELMSIVQTVVKYDVNKYIVDLQSISIVPGTTCCTFIRNDDDVLFILEEDRVIPQANNEEDEELVQTERRARRVHKCSSSAVDIVGTSEDRPNVTPADSDNVTTWVIPEAESYSFGMGGSRNLWKAKMSNKTMLDLVCLMDNCTWKLRVVRRDETTYFQVRSFVNEHTFPLEEIHLCHRQASAVIIGEVVAPRLQHQDGRLMRPKDIITYMKIMYVINPVQGFRRCIRPVITIDGTYLKKRFGGTMFVATAQDGNEQTRYHRKDITVIMDKATRAYTELKYNRYIEELRNLHMNAYDYVIDAGPYKWSHVHYPDRRAAQSMRHQLTDATHLVILKRVEKCNFMTLNPVDWNIFSVKRSRK